MFHHKPEIDQDHGEEAGIEIDNTGGTAYVYSNSLTANDTGINVTAGTVYAMNNAALGNATADFAGAFDATSDYNASSDASAPTVANSLTLVTAANNFTDLTAGAEDLHLKDALADCVGKGTDLSFNVPIRVKTDIDGSDRGDAVDIGADTLDNIWTGATDDKWFNAGNWSLGTVPGAGDIAKFNGTGNTDCVVETYESGVQDGQVPDGLGGILLDSGYTSTLKFEKRAMATTTDANGMTLSVTGSITVNSGNMVFEGDPEVINEDNGGTAEEPYGIGYTITAADITVAESASMNADGMGFPYTNSGPGIGPGGGGYNSPAEAGGGYGGRGGDAGELRGKGVKRGGVRRGENGG